MLYMTEPLNSVNTKSAVENDEDLILRVQAGDLHAFEPLVDRYLPPMRAFLALRVPAEHLIDELAHETFVFAYRHIAEFEPGSSFSSWLRAIAWNLLRAELQRFSRERANQVRFAHSYRLQALEREGTKQECQEAAFLEECLHRLPSLMRELVSLKYQASASSEDIAKKLNRSISWVCTTLFRVRQQLKQCIDQKLGRNEPC